MFSPVLSLNYDKEIGYKAFFNGNTGLYGRTGLLEKTGEKVVDTGIDPFNSQSLSGCTLYDLSIPKLALKGISSIIWFGRI